MFPSRVPIGAPENIKTAPVPIQFFHSLVGDKTELQGRKAGHGISKNYGYCS